MKDLDFLTKLVCAPHCRFYRPGEKEELSCAGYEFFRNRLSPELGKILSERFSASRPPDRFEHVPALEERICADCPFREEDCDFMSGIEMEDAVPCGGYMLLALMLAAGLDPAREWLDEDA